MPSFCNITYQRGHNFYVRPNETWLKRLKKEIFAATSLLLLLGAGTALAGTYDALCGDVECQISVSGKGVSSPAGFTPTELISQWNVGKASDYDAGKGVAGGLGGATAGAIGGAVLLGPIGLLGGLIGGAIAGADAGKEFEGYFTIVGYNKKGEKIAHNFYFINKKPVKRLLSELPVVTGLALGEERDLNDIEAAFSREGPSANTKDDLPSRLGQTKTAAKKNKCWSDYLNSNPAMAVWAGNNPSLAEKQRVKSGYNLCEQD